MEENSTHSAKVLEVNSSSIIDLKAELYRKQEQFKREKLQSSLGYTRPKTQEKKPTIWSRKNPGISERNRKDLETSEEEENELERSKAALLAKTRMYDKMTRDNYVPDEETSEMFLVDFEKKAVDKVFEKIDKERLQEEKSDIAPGDEWVDYTDSLGRSRRCMRKDLAHLQQIDSTLQNRKASSADEPSLLSEDMRRELVRQKWEAEELEALDTPVGPIHYADVQHKEIRTHGVGFYQFARDEEERQAQMKSLDELRDKTQEQRSKREMLKAKRKAVLDARLAKVKQRRNIKADTGGSEVSEGEDIGPKPGEMFEEKSDAEARTQEEKKKRQGPVREWDIGKSLEMTWQRKLQSLRDERPEEFAPPSMYYESAYNSNLTPGGRPQEFSPPSSYFNESQSCSIQTKENQYATVLPPNSLLMKESQKTTSESSDTFSYLKNLKPGNASQVNSEESAVIVPDTTTDLCSIPLPGGAVTSRPLTSDNTHLPIEMKVPVLEKSEQNPQSSASKSSLISNQSSAVAYSQPLMVDDAGPASDTCISSSHSETISTNVSLSAQPVAYDTRLQMSKESCSIANNEDAEFYQTLNDTSDAITTETISVDGVRFPLSLPLPPVHSHLPPEKIPTVFEHMAEIKKHAPKETHRQLELNRLAQLGVKNPELNKCRAIPDFTRDYVPNKSSVGKNRVNDNRIFVQPHATPSRGYTSHQLPKEKKDYSYKVKFTNDTIGDALKFFREKAENAPGKN